MAYLLVRVARACTMTRFSLRGHTGYSVAQWPCLTVAEATYN